MTRKSSPHDGSQKEIPEKKNQGSIDSARSVNRTNSDEAFRTLKTSSKKDFSDITDSPVRKKENSIPREGTGARGASVSSYESVKDASERTKSSRRYRDSGSDAHPGGKYCSATKHEPCGSAPLFSVEKLKELISKAEAHANGSEIKPAGKKNEVPQSTAQTVHIAQNLDIKNLTVKDKSQPSAVSYQATNHEAFAPIQHKSNNAASRPEANSTSGTEIKESPPTKQSRAGRSFSSPEYDIQQESMDFYQAHKKAFQAADQRFQNFPTAQANELREHQPLSVEHQNRGAFEGQKNLDQIKAEQTRFEQAEHIPARPNERIQPYLAINEQLAKNTIFNPPQGEYRVASIDKLDHNRHPEALLLDIPESRILSHVPAIGVDQILHTAERMTGGLPPVPRVGEILDAVEAMMETEPTNRIFDESQEEREGRKFIMLLDGKHGGLLFPIRKGEQKVQEDGTIPSITKIILPPDFKFVREGKFSAKVNLPDIKGLIAKIKSKLTGKPPKIDASENPPPPKTIFTPTVVNPQGTGTIVVRDLKPGAAEPEPLASQLIKAQRIKKEEEKKQESAEKRPESKTGSKDPYQGKLPEIKMSYSKNQPGTKDFTKLKPQEKLPFGETAEKSQDVDSKQQPSTRIRDIYAKFDIQLPRKRMKPEITESGTYKIIPNQSSQKMTAASEQNMAAPYEVASSIFREDDDALGDPRNPENKPFPKVPQSEEPRQSYVVKQGETVEYISVAELQDASLAPLLREINRILFDHFYDHEKQQPVSVLPAGLMILLPNKKDIIAFRLKIARSRNS